MASLHEYRNKDGKLISYSIRVARGRDGSGKQLPPWTTTFKVEPGRSEKTARKKAEAFAATFERDCRNGKISSSHQRFADYCDHVIALKESRGVKHSVIFRYRQLAERIDRSIGRLKLKDIRPDHLNDLYSELMGTETQRSAARAVARIDMIALLQEKGISRAALSRATGLPISCIYTVVAGKEISADKADMIAKALDTELEKMFSVTERSRKLATSTVLAHHRLIHTVLAQAVKEGLVPYNVADQATPPRAEKNEVDWFTPQQVIAIRNALEDEPLKWKVITHIFLITGARRGEIVGLKWRAIDFAREQIHICNEILYSPEQGLYDETPKTSKSDRYIAIPHETVVLLQEYAQWQKEERLRYKGRYQDGDYVFTQTNGRPMHPDSINAWLKKFSLRHDLPKIHPHAFRHTMASFLYYGKADPVSVSNRLGHSEVSTTMDIYAHVIAEADHENVQILEKMFLQDGDSGSSAS